MSWGKIGKIGLGALGAAAAPFTGGASLMATLGALGLGAGGAAASAFGGSGKQGRQEQTQESEQTRDLTETSETNQLNEALEPGYFEDFRKSLLPKFGEEFNRLQKPIYGPEQTALFMSDLNDLAKRSMGSLRANLARSGATDSGRLSRGLVDIESERLRSAGKFFAGLPFQEETARRTGFANLLGLGSNLAGRAPVSQRTTGTQTNRQTGTVRGTGSGETTMFGPSFGKAFLGQLGQVGGGMLPDILKLLGNRNSANILAGPGGNPSWGRIPGQ